jgi:hypothetical protein
MASLPPPPTAIDDMTGGTRNTETTVNDSSLTSNHGVHKQQHDDNLGFSITRRTSNTVTAVRDAILKVAQAGCDEIFNPDRLPPANDVYDYQEHPDITPPSHIPPAEDVFDYSEPIITPPSHLPPAEDVFEFKEPDE